MSKFELVKELSKKAGNGGFDKKLKGMIIAIANDQVTESDANAYEAKGVFKYEDMIESLNKQIKKKNRVKHAFNTMDELNDFMENNDCGDFWDEGEKWCVYAY